MLANHPILRYAEIISARQPFRTIKGVVSAYIAYPIAELTEKRDIRSKLAELRRFYVMPFEHRRRIALQRLADTLAFAGTHVPYYRNIFGVLRFDPNNVRRDQRYLEDLPFLTKDIIREQGDRLLSKRLADTKHHVRKTGGSTGSSCFIYYDQEGLDYAAAVTLYARESIGKRKHKSELHFACRFPDVVPERWPSREDFKCFAMNRSNIFFDRIDEEGLAEIWQTLRRRRPYLVHAHPSTIYALACYVERTYGRAKAFQVFESSGELIEPYMRDAIARALGCRVVDRYGLAELGIMAYELNGNEASLSVFESEGWPESRLIDAGAHQGEHELVFTGFRNRLMPLIRYTTGDLGKIEERGDGFYLTDVVGRIHDVVPINGVVHPTHHIQDMLDHRVGGIQEFQIDLRTSPPTLRVVLESNASPDQTAAKIDTYWPKAFVIAFVNHDELVRVGHRAKFRHVVTE
jgi:phenylacetate-CoA ligase